MKQLRHIFTIMCLGAAIAAQGADFTGYDAAMRKGNYSEAREIMTRIISEATQKTDDMYYRRALAFEKAGNYIYAVIDCNSALELAPKKTDYYLLMGRCKKRINDPTYADDLRNAGAEGLALLDQKPARPAPAAAATPTATHRPSDVDLNIPLTGVSNPNTFVLIFGIENYLEDGISSVEYALNDGEQFRQYCIRTLGIPEQNIHVRSDATRNQIRSEIKWARNISQAYGNEADMLVYYSGHGMPDEKSKKAYLLPADGIANDAESAYSLSSLYEEFGSMNFNSTLIMLDACFSGTKRDGALLTAAKGIRIKPVEEELTGNVAVLSASQGDETAWPDTENSHGLFTYYLLKKLQESRGNVTIGELADYVADNVRKASVVRRGTMQEPSANYSTDSTVNLRNIKLGRK